MDIEVTFCTAAEAEAAAAAVVEAGVPPASIEVRHGVLPEARGREAPFVWRVLVAIVLWSIAGAVPGAAFGWVLAETIGPEGTAGLIVQVVCWMIVGHLLGGMLAGYALLADRSAEEMPPDRPVSVLIVRGLGAADESRVRHLLESCRPLELRAASASLR